MFKHAYIHMCIYVYICLHICIYIYICIRIHIYIYIYIYMYIHMYVRICIHTHTHTHIVNSTDVMKDCRTQDASDAAAAEAREPRLVAPEV